MRSLSLWTLTNYRLYLWIQGDQSNCFCLKTLNFIKKFNRCQIEIAERLNWTAFTSLFSWDTCWADYASWVEKRSLEHACRWLISNLAVWVRGCSNFGSIPGAKQIFSKTILFFSWGCLEGAFAKHSWSPALCWRPQYPGCNFCSPQSWCSRHFFEYGRY